jgi:hypothetical protein
MTNRDALIEPTPLHKLPRGHTPRRHILVMSNKCQRRGKDKLRRDFEV